MSDISADISGDLAATPAGIHVTHEAARRRRSEGPGADRSWRIGADGEIAVAAVLSRLTQESVLDRALGRAPRWRVLHAVPLGLSEGRMRDIDHLVLGPPGVVTINTHHHPRGRVVVEGDSVLVGGRSVEHVASARAEAARAEEALSAALGRPVRARPIVALVGALLWQRRAPAGVTVCTAADLVATLNALPPVWGRSEVADAFAAARRPATWVAR
ncbi:nuclease-related domain-containing protein [Pseudonocardia sp. CA-107938]|uniref:nuclease-related domain-containing protein n=1 Tax=Pseudonocardia sp. CA-107938 TaxID=3240021 RepID=UPI003D8F70A1